MRGVLAAALLALAVPACASASTAELVFEGRGGDVLIYQAADGEANDLTVTEAGPAAVELTDPGAEITPKNGCQASGTHSVICGVGDQGVTAMLGDESDKFTGGGPGGFTVNGGGGADELDSGTSAGTLSGDDGDDTLTAHTGSFELLGGEGDDDIHGGDGYDLMYGGPGADDMDGGADQADVGFLGDVVSYRDHTEGVTVDLSTPGSTAGAAGEGDTVTNVENVYGGEGGDDLTATTDLTPNGRGSQVLGFGGDDVLHGGPGRDTIGGGEGDDHIEAGAGNDLIGGEEGHDSFDAGPGANTVDSDDGPHPVRELVDCGDGGTAYPGEATTALLDVIDQSCATVAFFQFSPIRRVTYSYPGSPTRSVRSTVGCRFHCRITVTLHAHRRFVGTATREIPRGQRGALTVPLGQALRDELAQTGVLRLHYSMGIRFGQRLHHRQATSWNLLLHDPAAVPR